MNKKEDPTKELLKKSMLKLDSPDFNDKVMQAIQEGERKKQHSLSSSISKAWIFAILAVLLIPSLIITMVNQSISIFPGITLEFNDNSSISLIFSVVFGSLILILIDSLVSVRKKTHDF